MRFLLILALLWDLSPIPVVAQTYRGPQSSSRGAPVTAVNVNPASPTLVGQGQIGLTPTLAPVNPRLSLETPAIAPASPALAAEAVAASPIFQAAAQAHAVRPQSGAEQLRVIGREFGARSSRLEPQEAGRPYDGNKPAPAALGAESAPLEAPEAGASNGLAPSQGAARPSAASAPPQPSRPGAPSGRGGKFRTFWPNLFTAANMASGVLSIILSMNGAFVPAAIAILAANVFDAFDGRVARALKADNPYGIDLDSGADGISFGVAPALLIYQAALHSLGPVITISGVAIGLGGFAVIAAFAFAAVSRLARFDVKAHAEKEGRLQPRPGSFEGLPSPGGAGVVVALTLALGVIPSAFVLPLAAGVTLLAAAAMVSTVPYPAFKKSAKSLLVPAAAVLVVAATLIPLGLAALIPAGVFGLYLLAGPLKAVYDGGSDSFRMELKRKAFHQSTLIYAAGFLLIPAPYSLYLTAAWLVSYFALETIRLKTDWGRRKARDLFGAILREKEEGRYTGAFYVSLGVSTVIFLFHSFPPIVLASILYLAWGDAVSSLVGKRWGRHPYSVTARGKTVQRTVEGTAAGFAAALAIGVGLGFSPWAALAAAVVFSLFDNVPLDNAPFAPDDNFWIPVATAAALYALGLWI